MDFIQFRNRFINTYGLFVPSWFNLQFGNLVTFEIKDSTYIDCEFNDALLNMQASDRFQMKIESYYSFFSHQEEQNFDSFMKNFMDLYCADIKRFVDIKTKETELYKSYLEECPYPKICFEIRHEEDSFSKDYLINHPFKSIGKYKLFFNIYEKELNRYISINHDLMKKWNEDIGSLFDIASYNQEKLFSYDIQTHYVEDDISQDFYVVSSNSAYNLCHVFASINPAKDIAEEIDDNLFIFPGLENNFSMPFFMIPEKNKNLVQGFIELAKVENTDYMFYTCKNGMDKIVVGEEEIKDLQALLNDYERDASERYLESGIKEMDIVKHKDYTIKETKDGYSIIYQGEEIKFKDLDSAIEYIDDLCSYNYKIEKTDVSNDVKEHINSYFNESSGLKNFEVVSIQRASNHPEDEYIYEVIAKNKETNTYSLWSAWNEQIQSLNNGIHEIDSLAEAKKIADDYFCDIDKEYIQTNKVI